MLDYKRYIVFYCNLVLLFVIPSTSFAQILSEQPSDSSSGSHFLKKIPYKELAVPVGLITYGIVAKGNPVLKGIDEDIRKSVSRGNGRKIKLDDFTRLAGTAGVFVLDAAGIPAKHNLKQRLFTTAVSNIIMTSTVKIMKSTIPVWRPDSSANNSFPSGHAATAFVGAELLWQEYRQESIWYGIAGYAVAAGTGYLRMHNDKHWFSDIAMGAGVGILSTKIAYWLLPLVDSRLQNSKKSYVVLPTYNGRQFCLSASLQF